MAVINYATEYFQALQQEFPYVLYFGALFNSPENSRFRWVNSHVIEVPTITTGGRVDGNRDNLGTRKRNYDNAWTPLTLSNHRMWQTFVHPRDIDETNQVASIANITRVFNDEQKFPEMNAYLISKLYADWTDSSLGGKTASTKALTTANILEEFDAFMTSMDEARVPRTGRILYLTPAAKALLTGATQIARQLDVKDTSTALQRGISSLDDVEVVSVPSDMMKTAYKMYF